RTGLSTQISSTRQVNSGFQKIDSSTPRAAEGVITGYVTRSTFISGRVKQAKSAQTRTASGGSDLIVGPFYPDSGVTERAVNETRVLYASPPCVLPNPARTSPVFPVGGHRGRCRVLRRTPRPT